MSYVALNRGVDFLFDPNSQGLKRKMVVHEKSKHNIRNIGNDCLNVNFLRKR
jgi:predicted small metal-binding protein